MKGSSPPVTTGCCSLLDAPPSSSSSLSAPRQDSTQARDAGSGHPRDGWPRGSVARARLAAPGALAAQRRARAAGDCQCQPHRRQHPRWALGPSTALPRLLGGDGAGTVVEGDDEGGRFRAGDRVAALTPGYTAASPTGTYAELAVIDSAHLAHVPPGMSWEVAGGLPLVGLTAWQALQAAKPVAGQRLLVFAASGGLGHMAVQLGKELGLHVVAVAGPSNQGWLHELGADETLDYASQDVFAALAGAPLDIVFDPLPNPPERMARLLSVLKPAGHYSHVRNTGGTDHAVVESVRATADAGRGPSISVTVVQPNGEQLGHLFGLWSAGALRLHVEAVLPLSEVAEAHARIEGGHTRGKLLLAIPAADTAAAE